eukprot:11193492-Lingulodinium_polyedra.AAC.1
MPRRLRARVGKLRLGCISVRARRTHWGPVVSRRCQQQLLTMEPAMGRPESFMSNGHVAARW